MMSGEEPNFVFQKPPLRMTAGGAAQLIFSRRKIAAEDRIYAEQREKAGGNVHGGDLLGVALASQIESCRADTRRARKMYG